MKNLLKRIMIYLLVMATIMTNMDVYVFGAEQRYVGYQTGTFASAKEEKTIPYKVPAIKNTQVGKRKMLSENYFFRNDCAVGKQNQKIDYKEVSVKEEKTGNITVTEGEQSKKAIVEKGEGGEKEMSEKEEDSESVTQDKEEDGEEAADKKEDGEKATEDREEDSEKTTAGKGEDGGKSTEGKGESSEERTSIKEQETESTKAVKEEQTATEEEAQKKQSTDSMNKKAQEKQEQKQRNMEISPFSTLGPHDITMPDVTSHYFKLQKNSTKVGSATGANLKVVTDEIAASKYLYEEYPNGSAYNFTPRFTEKTRVAIGGGAGGGVSFDKVKESNYNRFGDVYSSVNKNILQGHVYNLDQCTTDPYAVYTDVGTWYDTNTGHTYNVDMKLSITGYKFPGEAIRKNLANPYVAPYAGFNNNKIGITTMGTDYIQAKMEFYYQGTTQPIEGIKGVIQFIDIDAQQGIDFGNGFQKILMFHTGNSHLQFNANGLLGLGYVSSRVVTETDNSDKNTTVMGIFDGASVTCRWTVAKCDHKDTGGKAEYGVADGYGIPADSSQADSISYYFSNSTGFVGVATRIGILPTPPGVKKSVYRESMKGTALSDQKTAITLEDRYQNYTYVLSAAAATPSNLNKVRYENFQFNDNVSPLVNIKNIKVYADTALNSPLQSMSYTDVTSGFDITTISLPDHTTQVLAKAKTEELARSSFYGKTYYLQIEVQVKKDVELSAIGRDIAQWYQKDNGMEQKVPGTGNYRGTVAVDNQGEIHAKTNLGNQCDLLSNYVSTKIPMLLRVKKLDQATGKPVSGVTFGLFAGEDAEDLQQKTPIVTAKTNEEGVAVFHGTPSFYNEISGDGPYCIKEIGVPEKFENVWVPSVNTKWVYKIPSLQNKEVMQSATERLDAIPASAILYNMNVLTRKNAILVKKQSAQTGEYLSGAKFVLYEWSEQNSGYQKLMTLEEQKDGKGYPFYSNDREFINTMDNLGKYKIVEEKAPKGCIITGNEWTFVINEQTKEDGSNIIYHCEKTGKSQNGVLIYKNPLQKGILQLLKKDDSGQYVEGATFTVTAAEDIYAPWNLDENGKPLKNAAPLVEKGTVADTIVTDRQGRGNSTKGKELFIGKYIVEETGKTPNHIVGEDTYEVEFCYGQDQEAETVFYQLDVSNTLMKPALSVAKIADRTVNAQGEKVSFSSETGRYTEKKVAGIYRGSEIIEYTITVTNTGNVDLYNVKLEDDMDSISELYKNSLSQYVDMSTASFVIPKSGEFKTRLGNTIKGSLSSESNLSMLFHKLAVGDSVSVPLTVNINKEAANAFQLENDVYVSADYDNNGGNLSGRDLVEVPTEDLTDPSGESLVMDKDYINIPGETGDSPLKVADRTTGIEIENGNMVSGTKVPGIYYEGEEVIFTVYVKNTGTANLKNILVEDCMSEVLSSIVDKERASFVLNEAGEKETVLMSAGGKKISARLLSPTKVQLCYGGNDTKGEDRLEKEDFVALDFHVTILRDVSNLYDLSNEVILNAQYFDGNEDQDVEEKRDEDKIEVPGTPLTEVAKLANKTMGAELTDGRYVGTKVTGTYENEEEVTYTITVTNIGTSCLYHLELEDVMSEELKRALIEKSITFQAGDYTTKDGRLARSLLSKNTVMTLDFLAPKDSVTVYLHAKVRKDAGNLFELDNVVNLQAFSKKGNEEEAQKKEEEKEEAAKTYELLYDANDGEKKQSRDSETPCSAGKHIRINGNGFIKEDYQFLGWNTEQDGSGSIYKPGEDYKMPKKNVILYAQWAKTEPETVGENQRYRLFYDSNNKYGQREVDEENEKVAGYGIGINENQFIYAGYSFTGWNTRPDGKGTSYKAGDHYILQAKDAVLYAQWTKHAVYKLTYDANNETGIFHVDANTPCEKGTKIEINGNPYYYVKDGVTFQFIGWNTRPDGSGDSYVPGEKKEINADVTLYAQWEKEEKGSLEQPEYALIYRANDKTDRWMTDGETLTVEGSTVKIDENCFVREGYLFKEWNTRADGSGKSYQPKDSYTILKHTGYLYAQWEEEKKVSLLYSSNTEEERMVCDAQTPTAPETEIVTDGNPFTRNGYIFTGWNTKKDGTGQEYPSGKTIIIKEDCVLYAQWTVHTEQYILSYSSNYPAGKAGEPEKIEEQEVDGETACYEGTQITVNDNYFSCKGYQFSGWNTKRDGSGEAYQPDDFYQIPEKDIILFAQWEKLPEYTLWYQANYEGQGEMSSPNAIQDKETPVAKGDSIFVDDNLFVREGYEFAGWNLKKDGSGKVILPGKEVLLKEDTVFYAQWRSAEDGKEENTPLPEVPESNPGLSSAEKVTQEAIEQAYQEIQKINVQEALKAADDFSRLPVTELMMDHDKINVPGTPCTKVAKLANLTTGVKLVDGRYVGNKKEGIYECAQTVDYTITITNAGTADLYDIVVTDTLEPRLLNALEENSIRFEGGTFLTKNGNSLEAKESAAAQNKSTKVLLLNHLPAFDSVTLHLTAIVKSGEKAQENLDNVVNIAAKYQVSKENFIDLPETPEMTDHDTIGIGVPELVAAKLANKTTGVKLKKGRYEGKKKTGVYKIGEQITFSITISNIGNGTAHQVTVKDTPTTELSKYVDIEGFNLKEGKILKTNLGKKVQILSVRKNEFTIDQLTAGDSFQVSYKAKVKDSAVTASALKNIVVVTGKHNDGGEIAETKLMSDFDKMNIRIPEGTKKETSPAKTGDSSQIYRMIGLFGISLLLMLLVLYRRKKMK